MAGAMRSGSGAHSKSSGRRQHHSNPLEGSSALHPPPKKARGKKATAPSSISTSSKEEQRRHRAIEKAILRAQAQVAPNDNGHAATAITAASSPRAARELSPDLSVSASGAPASDSQLMFQMLPDQTSSLRSQDSATIQAAPPTAQPPHSSAMADSLEAIISWAIRQSLAQCLQPGRVPAAPGTLQQTQSRDMEDSYSDQDRIESQSSADQASVSEVDKFQDQAWSDDEGLGPDQPSFIGLFRPQVFHSLLFKAIATTHLGDPPPSAGTSSLSDLATAMFAEPIIDPETIPAPKLFTDVLQCHWTLPGAGPSPNGLDKHLYNSAAPLVDLLQPPSVDPPITALTNTSHPTGPAEDSLWPEDK